MNPTGYPPEYRVKKMFFRARSFLVVCREDRPSDASWFSFTDEAEVRSRWWNIEPGDVVIDAGAAYGSYALTAMVQGAAKVFCWSPEGNEYDLLVASAEANGWSRMVVVRRDGLWSTPGAVVPYSYERPTSFHSSCREAAAEAAAYVRRKDEHMPRAFPVSTVDNVVIYEHDAKRVDWLKIDTEGAEVEVLRGSTEVIQRFKPKILVENHLFKDPSLKDNAAALIKIIEPSYEEVGTVPYGQISHSLYVSK